MRLAKWFMLGAELVVLSSCLMLFATGCDSSSTNAKDPAATNADDQAAREAMQKHYAEQQQKGASKKAH